MLLLAIAPVQAREGETMAPGRAQLQRLDPAGDMTVMVLERVFTGSWRSTRDVRETAMLAEHWQGSAQALAQRPLAVALLDSAQGTRMRCEFVNDLHRLAGVCEEIGSRLYYLSR